MQWIATKRAIIEGWTSFKRAWDWASFAQGLLVLVPPGWASWVSARLALDQGATALTVFLIGVAVFLAIALAQSLFRPLLLKILSALVVVALSTAALIWGADQYRLEFEGVQLVPTPMAGASAPSAKSIKVGIRLKNPNHFPVYWTSRLRLVSAGGKIGEQDYQYEYGGVTDDSHVSAAMNQGEIPLNIASLPAMKKPLTGQMYFIVCYGRKESDQHKSLIVKGTIRYMLDQYGRFVQPIVEHEAGPEPEWQCDARGPAIQGNN